VSQVVLCVTGGADTSPRPDEPLRASGWSVEEVATGAGALTRVRELSPSAVVIAGDPDDMPATELCRQLATSTDAKAIPIVLVRDDASPASRLAAVNAGAHACLATSEAGAALVPTLRALERLGAAAPGEAGVADALAEERARREQAELAARAKDEVLAVVSHELRSPLNAILGWTRVLQSGPPDTATLAHGLEAIARSVQAQSKLLTDLLDTVRVVTGKVQLTTQPVDLQSVVTRARDGLDPLAQARHVLIHAHVDPRARIVTGDPDRLVQIVSNLLSNAIKFSAEGARVELEVAPGDEDVRISVRDTGKGLAAEQIPHVFEPFRLSEGPQGRRKGGLGFGLALVKSLTELHGGRVTVESAGRDQGATFTVTLPRGDVPATFGVSAPRDAKGSAKLQDVVILVVEDDANAREAMRVALERYGGHVLVAGSASEALDLLHERQAEVGRLVLVADIGMPERDGYWLIRKVRELDAEHGGRIPAVALTGFGSVRDRISALEAGFQLHLTKPFDPARLASLLAGLVQQRSVMPPVRQ
jgi:signal transduction histidine kinase/ActR/RegA family two-component response regulator